MISIFNGRSRTLGGATSAIHVQVSVDMRQHLHLFKGAALGVFLAIALHADEEGFAFPSVPLLCRETGYNKDAVFKALSHLRDLQIEGHRILCSVQRAGEKGKFGSNGYLIFPCAKDAELYDTKKAARDAHRAESSSATSSNSVISPCTGFPYTDKPESVEPDTAAPDTAKPEPENPDTKQNHREAEPASSISIYGSTTTKEATAQQIDGDVPAAVPHKNEVCTSNALLEELVAAAVAMGVGVSADSARSTIKEALAQQGGGGEARVRRTIAWYPASNTCKKADSVEKSFRVAVRGDWAKNSADAKAEQAVEQKQKEVSRRYVQSPKADAPIKRTGSLERAGVAAAEAVSEEFTEEQLDAIHQTLSGCGKEAVFREAIERALGTARPGTDAYEQIKSAQKSGFIPLNGAGRRAILKERKAVLTERARMPLYDANGNVFYDKADLAAAQKSLDYD